MFTDLEKAIKTQIKQFNTPLTDSFKYHWHVLVSILPELQQNFCN